MRRSLLVYLMVLVMLCACFVGTSVTGFAGDKNLDLDSTTTEVLDSTTVDQGYALNQSGTTYVEKYKVKVEWTIADIETGYTLQKTWDTEKLEWVEEKLYSDFSPVSAAFKFTNFSSKSVGISAKFAYSLVTKEAVTASDTVESCVGTDDGRTVSSPASAPSKTLTLTYTPGKDDFKDQDDSGTYGTYTLSISQK